jgi:transposase
MDEKIGGPYTKQEQETRKEQVFELHFEQGISAVQIAKILGVNRNTITKDIQILYSKLREDKPEYGKNWLDKQLFRLESQRTRLQQILQKEIALKDTLQIEKSITYIDLSIAGIIVRIETARKYVRI